MIHLYPKWVQVNYLSPDVQSSHYLRSFTPPGIQGTRAQQQQFPNYWTIPSKPVPLVSISASSNQTPPNGALKSRCSTTEPACQRRCYPWHYRQHEMPDIFYKNSQLPETIAEDENRKTYSTQDTYEGYLKKWILPRWKSYRLQDVKALQVEQWLKSLPLAPGSKAKIRNIMSALYSHAIRWEWIMHNPITYVRQSAKRRNTPAILTIEQIKCFLSHLKEPCRTAVMLDASSGRT